MTILPRADRVRAVADAVSRRAAAVPPARLIAALVAMQWLLTIVTALAVGRSGPIWIVVPQVAVLLPLALVLVHETALRLGGKSFAAWAAVVWVALPYAGLAYANHSFRDDYAHRFLPRVLGLADDPRTAAMVCLITALFFTLRAIETTRRADAAVALAAAAAGAAFAPRAALVGLVPLVGLALGGRIKDAIRSAPALAILLGAVGAAVAGGLLAGPFAHVGLHAPADTLSSLSENLWSGRVLEWLAIAGLVGAIRGNRAAGAMIAVAAGAAFMSLHGETLPASRNLSLLYALLPAWPAVALAVASLPLLWPGRHPAGRTTSRTAMEPSGPA